MSLFTSLRLWAESVIRPRMASLRSKLGDERGATTLEYVIIAAIVCVAAIALAAVIVSAIQSFQARIPTGP